MTQSGFTEDEIMAYADGNGDPSLTRAIQAAAEQDEVLARKISMYRATGDLARDALQPLLSDPVPDALTNSIRAFAERHPPQSSPAGNVVAFAQPQRRAPMARPTWMPMGIGLAACLVLAVGGGAGYLFGAGSFGSGAGDPSIVTASLDQPGLLGALVSVASGEEEMLPGGERFRAIGTFTADAGALCREFELDEPGAGTLVAVACQTGGTWATTFSVAALPNDAGYAPASSLETLQAYLDSIGAAPPMALDEEASALQAARENRTN